MWRLPFLRSRLGPERPRTRSAFLRALQSPLLFAWNPALREPNDEYRAAWSDVTARTVDALHNSGWLAGGVEQATAMMVGPMMALNSRPDPAVFGDDEVAAAKWSRVVERRFELWARSAYDCDFTGRQNLGQMCAQAVKQWFGLGEITGLVRYRVRPGDTLSVRVTVTYDEAGRVTQASVAGATPGAEAYGSTAVRIARGKHFPAGKPGSTVVTIPVN